MSDQHRGVPEHVLRAGAATAASSRLVQAVRSAERAADVPDPAHGQLWRALWDDAAQLVLVLRVTGMGLAVVAPVTTDPPTSDESSVVLDAGLTVLGHTAIVWGGLAAEIPFRVFDLLIGQMPAATVDAAERVASGDYAGVLPEGVSVGTRVTSPFDRAAEVRAELSDTLVNLGRATWAPQVPGSAQPLRDLLQGRQDVAALMKALAQALGLELPAVMNILTGKRPVTPGQAPAVAKITGLTEQQVLSAVPALPADLVTELDRPRWRKPLRAQRRPSESEAATRLTVAYGALALAARQTGPASAPSWPQRIRQYLATHPVDGCDR
jgi:hypothetical protein